ncbi:hypothetical protein LINPERHAP2_LOCUS40274 [Linum perenne]
MWPAGHFQSAMPLLAHSVLRLGWLRFPPPLIPHASAPPLHSFWLDFDDFWPDILPGFQEFLFSTPVVGLPYTVLHALRSPDATLPINLIMAFHGHAVSSVQFTAADLQDARERTELSLLAQIYWDESRDLRLVENSFIPVKIIGMPFACRTVVVGRKLLEPMGEVVHMGYFDAKKLEGCYVKGRVQMDLYSSFLGTTSVNGEDGTSFKVFFQYEGVPCICYLCGFLGHAMGDCSHMDLVFDPLVRDSWICGVTNPDEVETEGPNFQILIPSHPQAPRGRGGLPPSVAAWLSSNLHRQWAQNRQLGSRIRGVGPVVNGPRPFLSLSGPSACPQILQAEVGNRNGPSPVIRPSIMKQAEAPSSLNDI